MKVCVRDVRDLTLTIQTISTELEFCRPEYSAIETHDTYRKDQR